MRDSEDGSGHFMHIKEGMTQGLYLSMIAYGIGVLSLIQELWDAHPPVTQPWYADNAGAGGTSEQILTHFQDIQALETPQGYLPKLTKSVLVVAPRNVAMAEEFFKGMGVMMVAGSRYLGGYIGDKETEDIWLNKKVKGWEDSTKKLMGVACKNLYSAYTGLQKSFQHEREFMQRVTPNIGDAFKPVEQALR